MFFEYNVCFFRHELTHGLNRYLVLRLIAADIYIYYIDKSALVENRPLVKFIRNYIRDSSGVFSISSLVRILMTSFPALTLLSI